MANKMWWWIVVNNVTLMAQHGTCGSTCIGRIGVGVGSGVGVGIGVRFSGCCIPSLCPTRPLLARQISFGETLLPCLCFPIIITYSPTIHNYSAPKLPKHGPCCYDCYLSGAVRVRQDPLGYKIVLFRLFSNNLVERPILVEQ
jgi:hypothetical protein